MHKDFEISRRANAKLNLHLQVLNKRSDNYHNIFSIMAEIEVHDLLKLEAFDVKPDIPYIEIDIVNSGGSFSSVIDDIPPERNLISVAVKKYLQTAGYGGYIRFNIEKNIPSGAGLGGGSSDAACALNLVNEALDKRYDRDLFVAAESAGSDVPFFIKGGAAFSEGRGEILHKIDCRMQYPVLLVNNGIHVNTGEAYSALGRGKENLLSGNEIENRKKKMISALDDPANWKGFFINDFEQAVFLMHHELRLLKDALYDCGADFALMTGSGSTVYGVFKDKSIAEAAATELEKSGNKALLTKLHV